MVRDGDTRSLEELSEESRISFVGEFIEFLKHNKKWWMLPFLLLIALIGFLAVLSGTGVAPFIYPLF